MRTFGTKHEQQAAVERNIRAYRRVHRRYEGRHPDIFNPTEQERLRASLSAAVGAIATEANRPRRALDLGCGTGNVTEKLLELGLDVVAADVSPEFLEHVRARFEGRPLETMRVNGMDLDGFSDGVFDLVAAYSVLHHVPDYLEMLAEMHRVLRRGGVIYADHEANEAMWQRGGCLDELKRELHERALSRRDLWNPRRRRWQRFLMPSKYAFKLRRAIDPDWKIEGDIHTAHDDHIEWDAIDELLDRLGAEVVLRQDYLLYEPTCPDDLYERYRDTCSNTRLLVARRLWDS